MIQLVLSGKGIPVDLGEIASLAVAKPAAEYMFSSCVSSEHAQC